MSAAWLSSARLRPAAPRAELGRVESRVERAVLMARTNYSEEPSLVGENTVTALGADRRRSPNPLIPEVDLMGQIEPQKEKGPLRERASTLGGEFYISIMLLIVGRSQLS